MRTDVYCCVLMYTHVSLYDQCLEMCTDVYWRPEMYIVCSDVYCCALACTDVYVYWCELMYTDVNWYELMWPDVY